MALPTTITGALFPTTSHGNLGPFISSTGNVYFIAAFFDNPNHGLRVHKNTDPDNNNFTSAGNVTSLGEIGSAAAVQDGDTLHIVWQYTLEPGAVRDGAVGYRAFDMSNDTFATVQTLYDPTDNPAEFAVDIGLRSDGDIIVVYHGENPTTMGGTYQEIAYSRRESGSWTNGVVVASTGAKNDPYLYPQIPVDNDGLVGSGDQAIFAYVRTAVAQTTHLRGLSSANVLRTQRQVGPNVRGLAHPVIVNQGTERVVGASYTPNGSGQDQDAHYFNYFSDDTNPTYSTVTDPLAERNGTRNLQFTMAVDQEAATTASVFAIGFDDTVAGFGYVFREDQGDLTGTWATYKTKITQTALPVGASARVFQRGTNIVLAHIYDDNGTVTYDEYVIRSSGPTTITGTGALAFPAFDLAGAGIITKKGSGALTFPAAQIAGAGNVQKTGSGAITFSALALAGAGDVAAPPIGGSGALTFPAAQIAGSGVVVRVASGDIAFPSLTVAGSGDIVKTGSGDLAFPALQIAGAGKIARIASGALSLPGFVLSGAGGILKTASGALAFPALALAGAGDVSVQISGSGDLAFPAMTVSGAGLIVKTGSGDLALPGLTVSGLGAIVKTGSGAIAFPAAQIAGSGAIVRKGSGDIGFPALQIAGTGFAGAFILGQGAIVFPAAEISGSGKIARSASGDIAFPALQVAGAGQIVKVGTGALSMPAFQIAGAGNRLIDGSGALSMPAFVIDGAGVLSGLISGSGDLALPGFTIAGAGLIARQASGDIGFPAMTISGAGQTEAPITGSGDLGFPAFALSGQSVIVKTGSGDLVFPVLTIRGFQVIDLNGVTVIGAPVGPIILTGSVVGPIIITGAPPTGVVIIGEPE